MVKVHREDVNYRKDCVQDASSNLTAVLNHAMLFQKLIVEKEPLSSIINSQLHHIIIVMQ